MSMTTWSILALLAVGATAYFLVSGQYGTVIIGVVALAIGILYGEAKQKLGAETVSEVVGKLHDKIKTSGGYGTTLSHSVSNAFTQIHLYLMGHDKNFRPSFSVARTWQIWTARFLLISFGLFAFSQLGASNWFWMPWFYSFVLLLGGFQIKSSEVKNMITKVRGIGCLRPSEALWSVGLSYFG